MELQRIKLQMIKENTPIFTLDPILSADNIVELINAREKYDLSPTSKIIVVGLDNKNKINIYTEIATGATDFVNFKMSELFKPILLSNSNKFILIHNNPSGDSTPSKNDKEIAKKLKDISELMGITFLDFIIIGENNYKSVIKEEVK